MTPLSLDQLNPGPDTLVLCATPRLAAALRQRHARRQAEQGRTRWDALDCRTLAQWLAALREDWLLRGAPQALLRRPLTSFQERTVWETVIRQRLGVDAAPLFDIGALAQSAQEAHEWQEVWQVRPDRATLTEEHRQFQQWRTDFQAWCQQHGWTTPHELDAATMAAVIADPAAVRLPARLVLAGFHRLPPEVQAWLQALQTRGHAVLTLADEPRADRIDVLNYPDAAAECLAAALWAQARLDADPQAELAIVVPNLAELRLTLQDTLEDVLAPALLRASQAEAPRPFNISLGQPLADHPLVGAALALLEVMARPHALNQATWSALLRHPYWSDPAEAAARAQAEALARNTLPAATDLQAVCRWLTHGTGADAVQRQAPALIGHAEALLSLATAAHGARRLPSQWAADLWPWLQQAGWLYRRKLSSHEFQARQAFVETIQAFGLLDTFLGPLGWGEALRRLRQMCRERIFQPETEGRPRLQVLGLLEASGQRFDAVWIMGLRASVWPPAPRPNPLLPSEAQRRAGSPNASASVQQAFAEPVHQRLLCAAPEVMLSWPRAEGTAECHPSPLLAMVGKGTALPAPDSPHWTAQALLEPSRLAPPMDDHQAPPLTPDEVVRGGTALLKAQAICPAWAYYRYRLGAGKLEDGSDGLDPRQRGTLVHAALERFWAEVRTADRLQALGATGCHEVLERVIALALDARDAEAGQVPLPPRARRLEQARLTRLLSAWLEHERLRSQPFEVVATEERQALDLGGLPIRVQVDRIDRLEGGGLLMIDYKTGAQLDTSNWSCDRVTEPQLPLYAAVAAPNHHTGDTVVGVAFAQVHLKETGWAGLAAQDLGLARVHALDSPQGRKRFEATLFPDWPAVLAHWRAALHKVADEILRGEAAVRCADERQLQHCEVRPLLRLSERRAQWQALYRSTPRTSHTA